MAGPQLTSDQLSSIAGYMSLACWIVVYSPQLWENYLLQSGEGLSVAFLVCWLLGDLTNLFGGMLAKLVPVVVFIAIYYTICDCVLLFQVYFYRRKRREAVEAAASGIAQAQQPSESSPLLTAATDIPPPAQPKPFLPPHWEYPLLLAFVLGSGAVAWYFTGPSDDVSIPEKPGKGSEVELEWKSQTLGWLSAALYIGSRLPQIAHNRRTRCAGLSLAMFFFSISGNITYVTSILVISLDQKYLIVNGSWLAGAGITIFLDLFVLGQFFFYSLQDRKEREAKSSFDEEVHRGET